MVHLKYYGGDTEERAFLRVCDEAACAYAIEAIRPSNICAAMPKHRSTLTDVSVHGLGTGLGSYFVLQQ